MGWKTATGNEWIKTQKTSGTDFSRSFDFNSDETAGARYVAISILSASLVEEMRGLTEEAALALAAPANATTTMTAQTFTDTKSGTNGAKYSVTVPAIEGTKIRLEAHRANEARGWTVRKTTTTMTATAEWGDGSYGDAALSSTGTQKSASVRHYIQNVEAKWVPAVLVDGVPTSYWALITDIKTTETTEEWTGMTEAAAKAKAAQFGAHVTTVLEASGVSWESHYDEAEARYVGTNGGWAVRRLSKDSVVVGGVSGGASAGQVTGGT